MNKISKVILILFIILFFLLSFILTLKMAFNKPNVNQSVNINVNAEPNKKMNINTASEKELESLPTIGEKKAKLIAEYIKVHKITSIDELRNIKGIGCETIESLKSEVDAK